MTINRRAFLNACTSAGIASPLLPGILYTLAAQAQEPSPATSGSAVSKASTETKLPALPKITSEMLDQAAVLAGVGPFTAEQKKMMLGGLNDQRDAYAQIRALKIANDVPPAFVFHPAPPAKPAESRVAYEGAAPQLIFNDSESGEPKAPANIGDLAFASILELASLIWHRKITSVALTQMYIDRLKRYDPTLHFVITLLEDRALAQAKAADEDLENGLYRGPLHGIPWGAKDLLAVKGYPTTWGAGGFQQQTFKEDATVVQRLDEAGAVLVAKFSLGALAMGDKWFGGRTRNPWNPALGSSGSSSKLGQRRGRGLRRLRAWFRDARVNLLALNTLRYDGVETKFRHGAPHRRNGLELDDGQARADLPLSGRLRAGARCNSRA